MRFRYSDLVGKTEGKFRVLSVFYSEKNKALYKLQCIDCDVIKDQRCDVFRKDVTYCWDCENSNQHYKSRTYNSWDGMLQRCNNAKCDSYIKYGALGIKVQESWQMVDGEGFKNFLIDMGECPEGLTLDRIDGTKGYCKDNCRWADNSTQGFNQKKRSTNKSGRTGVSWSKEKGKWSAEITVNNKNIKLGRYSDFDLAVHVREEAELKYFGYIKE